MQKLYKKNMFFKAHFKAYTCKATLENAIKSGHTAKWNVTGERRDTLKGSQRISDNPH